MNSTVMFAVGMAIAAFFAALMLQQALSDSSVLGTDGRTRNSGYRWLSPVSSAFIVAVSFAALALMLV